MPVEALIAVIQDVTERKQAQAEVAPAEPRGGPVLYVEDEENDAMVMQMAFAAKGMKPALRVVGDGRAAIQYLSGAEPYADRAEYPLRRWCCWI